MSKRKRPWDEEGFRCPFLDTINRMVLDFDFEKACSVTGNNFNTYACLVCGKYFQGRGKHTQAYTHALQEGHHVYMNLQDGRVYCLPDGYEVVDSSLSDIQNMLNPEYAAATTTGTRARLARALPAARTARARLITAAARTSAGSPSRPSPSSTLCPCTRAASTARTTCPG